MTAGWAPSWALGSGGEGTGWWGRLPVWDRTPGLEPPWGRVVTHPPVSPSDRPPHRGAGDLGLHREQDRGEARVPEAAPRAGAGHTLLPCPGRGSREGGREGTGESSQERGLNSPHTVLQNFNLLLNRFEMYFKTSGYRLMALRWGAERAGLQAWPAPRAETGVCWVGRREAWLSHGKAMAVVPTAHLPCLPPIFSFFL